MSQMPPSIPEGPHSSDSFSNTDLPGANRVGQNSFLLRFFFSVKKTYPETCDATALVEEKRYRSDRRVGSCGFNADIMPKQQQ